MFPRLLLLTVLLLPEVRGQQTHVVYDIVAKRCCPGAECWPTQQDMSYFNNNLTGQLLLPHMEEYLQQLFMYNMIEVKYPAMFAMVKSVEDVRKSILFARKHNLHVTIKSSGHSFVGRSTWDGSFTINMADMTDIQVNLASTRHPSGEVKVQTGLSWKTIYEKLIPHKRVIVGGSAHSVKAGGYTLGGGHSPLSRSLGYAVDNVLEIQVVLYDGRIATCTENSTVIENLDGSKHTKDNGLLFWALRGGGGGTFGVVTYIVFKLHNEPTQMVKLFAVALFQSKSTIYELDQTEDVLQGLNNAIKAMPSEWGGYWIVSNAAGIVLANDTANPLNADIYYKGTLTIVMNKFGPWDNDTMKPFAELLQLRDLGRAIVVFENKSSFWDYEKDIYDPPVARTYLANVLLHENSFNDSLVEFFKDEFLGRGKDLPLGCTGTLLGGKTTNFSVDSTPLNPSYRTALTSLSCGIGLGNPLNPDVFQPPLKDRELINTMDGFATRLRMFGDGMYFNEPTKNNPYWKTDFWGKHYPRLLQIKFMYDPENFFTCHHCVGSEINPYKVTSTSATVVLNMSTLALALLSFLLFI